MSRILKYLLLITFLLFLTDVASGNRYNVSYDFLKQCQEYDVLGGYEYQHYFKIRELENTDQTDFSFNLKIILLATQDAHILLSPVPFANYSDSVYEIVLGGGDNTFCQIRKNKQKNPIKTKFAQDILSPIDPLPLIIKVNSDQENGTSIEVWIEDQTLPLISAVDPDPIETHYISFSSWGSSKAKFFYDCPYDKNDKNENDTDNEVFLEEVELNEYEKLEQHLFMDYDSNAYVEHVTNVSIDIKSFSRINYDDRQQQFDITVELDLIYYDSRLTWDPNDFNNLTYFSDNVNYVFTPGIMVSSGLHDSFESIDIHFDHKIRNTGKVIAKGRQTEFSVYCRSALDNLTTNMNYCDLAFSCDVTLDFHQRGEISDMILKKLNQRGNLIVKEIRVSQAEHFQVMKIPQLQKQLDLNFRFVFHQDVTGRLQILHACLFGGLTLLMLSAFVIGSLKVTLISLAILIFLCSLIASYTIMPAAFAPRIIFYYEISLLMTSMFLTVTAFEAWFNYVIPKTAPGWLMLLVNLPYLKLILGITKYSSNSSYDGLNQHNKTWMDVLNIINRLCFLITFLIAAIFIGQGY